MEMLIRKIIKWISTSKRKQALIDKIVNRANVCLYNKITGKKYKTMLYLNPNKYNACTGKKILKFRYATVRICIKGYDFLFDAYWIPNFEIARNGNIDTLDVLLRIKKDKQTGKLYIVE